MHREEHTRRKGKGNREQGFFFSGESGMDFDCVRFGVLFFSAVMFSFCEDKIAGNRSIKAKKRGRCACVYVCDVCGGYRL